MGGWGSGPYGPMGSLVRKRTVEETKHIYIQKVKNIPKNIAVTYSWGDDNQISIVSKGDYIALVYSIKGELITTEVNLDSTNVGYGKRLWFNCPMCEERTARLYLVGKYFSCRKCHNLTYLTCQESGDPLDYLYLKIRGLQNK
ncbi:hypothetical protein CN069_33885, partial [Sinorhizobium meliloti]